MCQNSLMYAWTQSELNVYPVTVLSVCYGQACWLPKGLLQRLRANGRKTVTSLVSTELPKHVFSDFQPPLLPNKRLLSDMVASYLYTSYCFKFSAQTNWKSSGFFQTCFNDLFPTWIVGSFGPCLQQFYHKHLCFLLIDMFCSRILMM